MNPKNNDSRTSGSRCRTLERKKSPQSVTRFPSPPRSSKIGDWSPDNNSSRRSVRTASSGSGSSVRFDRRVIMRLVRSHHDYKPNEIKDCFYQDYEMKEITNQCFEDIQRHLFGGNEDGHDLESYCHRGLEKFEPFDSREKRRLRAKASKKVFDAQDEGCDEMTIAREYATVTSRCQRWANIMGLRDRRGAIAIQREEDSR